MSDKMNLMYSLFVTTMIQAVRRVASLNNCLTGFKRELQGLPPTNMVEKLGNETGAVALSSFGTQAAVLLHMISEQAPDMPVVMIDTGYLFPETYRYAEELKILLGLNLHIATSEMSSARMEALYGKLWQSDDTSAHRLYGRLRKVDPANNILQSLNARVVISGLRASQTAARSKMEQIGFHEGRMKVFPMLYMSDAEVQSYIDEYGLPRHPLESKGYVSVGDWHSSRPLDAHETMIDARKTRFGGKFEECGLHLPPEAKNLDMALSILSATPQHESGLITHLVKKAVGNGFCKKCNQVDQKIQEQGLTEYIGGISTSTGDDSEGDILAQAFFVDRAPFFLVKEPAGQWKALDTFGEWRDLVQRWY